MACAGRPQGEHPWDKVRRGEGAPRATCFFSPWHVGGADGLFTRVHETQDRLSAPTCLWVLAQGGGCYTQRLTPALVGGGTPSGLAVGPDQEGPGVLAPNPTFQSSCQTAQPQGREWLHFLKNLCFVKN